MNRDSREFHRRSIRLKGYDYTNPGGYFVTICTQNKVNVFGVVKNEHMELNAAGCMIAEWTARIPDKFPGCILDCMIIMPNHLHIIFMLSGIDFFESQSIERNEAFSRAEQKNLQNPSLSSIIQWFKTMTTNEYIRNVKKDNWKPFTKRLWQRNYYERIIRNEKELEQKRNYVIYNASKWSEDPEFRY